MDTVIENLTVVCYSYKGFSKRNGEAKELADILDEQFLKPVEANGTLWVEHKLLAITKMIINYSVIILHMILNVGDQTNRAKYRAKTKDIFRKLLQFKFIYYLYFVKDILSEVSRVSLVFKRGDVYLSSTMICPKSACICYSK